MKKDAEVRLLFHERKKGRTRAASAIITIVESPKPPLRLVLGADALKNIRHKLASVAGEVDVWENTTVSAAFEHTSKEGS